jgi:hypothetical protein
MEFTSTGSFVDLPSPNRYHYTAYDWNFTAKGITNSLSYSGIHTHAVSITSAGVSVDHAHSVPLDLAGTGEDGTGKNIPTYYTLIFIMRVA